MLCLVQAQQRASELFQYSANEGARGNQLEAVASTTQRAAGRGRNPAAQAARASGKTRVKAERARERADWAAEQSTWAGESNGRFVVASSRREELDARSVFEGVYCLRGDAENRIKEQQLYLFADCLPCERTKFADFYRRLCMCWTCCYVATD